VTIITLRGSSFTETGFTTKNDALGAFNLSFEQDKSENRLQTIK